MDAKRLGGRFLGNYINKVSKSVPQMTFTNYQWENVSLRENSGGHHLFLFFPPSGHHLNQVAKSNITGSGTTWYHLPPDRKQ